MGADSAWSRRRFLSARGLGASTGGFLAHLVPRVPKRPCLRTADTFQYWTFARRAMGCEFCVMIPPTQPSPMASAEAALDEIGDLEQILSIYIGDSDLSRLNQRAAEGPVRVNYRLFSLLERAAELTRETQGAFDVAAGALVKAWGFSRGPKRVPAEAERLAALEQSGMRHVLLDCESASVRYQVPGMEINLGSIGKGYGIDQAFERIQRDFGTDCVLIQGGRSSMRAVGSPAGDSRGWLISIEDPCHRGRQVAMVNLRDRAMATSSTINQFFEADGQRHGHLIDPRTGYPANKLRSATVMAPDAATADALSTALFVMGLDKAADFCQNHPAIAALLVAGRLEADGQDASPRVVTFNLPPEDVVLTPGNDPPGT